MCDKTLKPCPICEHEVEILDETYSNGEHIYRIDCDNCGAHTYANYDKGELIKQWNHREEADDEHCPLCGHSVAYDYHDGRIWCNNPRCFFHSDNWDTEEEAWAAWRNKRK